MERAMRQLRAVAANFTTREDGEGKNPHIEGYFAVFDSVYDIFPGMTESIAAGAFDGVEAEDIRALTNHDTTLVLGRTTAGTLELRQDDRGLWGSIAINPNDGDAMNTWQRVLRGDVSQCSIGFDIIDEETEIRSDGSTHWTIRKVKLWEVSICTFPAYAETNVQARADDRATAIKRSRDAWKERMRKALSGNRNNDSGEK